MDTDGPLPWLRRRLALEGPQLTLRVNGPMSAADLRNVVEAPELCDERGKRLESVCVHLIGADLDGQEFDAPIDLSFVIFDGCSFRGATFGARAVFLKSVFRHAQRPPEPGPWSPVVDFRQTHFHGALDMGGAQFLGNADFWQCVFHDDLHMGHAIAQGHVRFEGARFVALRTFWPMTTLGGMSFDAATFAQPVRIEQAARELLCRRTQFLGGATLKLRWADVYLTGAQLCERTVVTGRPPFRHVDEQPLSVLCHERRNPFAGAPRIVSLRRINAAGLVLADVDLSACRFQGAVIESLSVAGRVEFAVERSPLRARRAVIDEELAIVRRDWQGALPAYAAPNPEGAYEISPHDELEEAAPERLAVAAVYRNLRRQYDNAGDAARAADFYYGEMEMIRKQASWREQRLVLEAYRALSGYGVRASRAVAWLVLAVLGFSLALDRWGIRGRHAFPDAVLIALRTGTSLTGIEQGLTPIGAWLEVTLRIVVVVLLATAVAAFTWRLKR